MTFFITSEILVIHEIAWVPFYTIDDSLVCSRKKTPVF